MNMPFGNFNNFIQGYQQFMAQKEQFLAQIPKEMGSSPNQIIQNLMNSGRISQSQYNQAKTIADQIQSFGRSGK